MIEKRYTIGELERLTKTNRRTIHFYVQLGLVPRPDSRGGAATYSEEALTRLNLIRELKRQRLTLEEIKEFFEKRDRRRQYLDRDSIYDHMVASPSMLYSSKNMLFEIPPQHLYIDNLHKHRYDEEIIKKEVEKEAVIKIKIAEGIELYIDKEKYKKYHSYIKKGISRFIDTLAEKRPGRPKRER
ncbi:MAG: MerR family transcriptional regulator [Thermodesulfovibrio sp.]|nr:MerR family transcriptional regulator [Thermodesulfovibrio sp.]